MVISNCNSDFVKWRGEGKCHIGLAMGKTVDDWYIPTPLSVYSWVLLIVSASKILIGNHHPLAMKCSRQTAAAVCPEYFIEFCRRENFRALSPTQFEGNGWIWWRLRNPGYKDSNRLTITSCWHRRPKKINIFHVFPMTSGRGHTINF